VRFEAVHLALGFSRHGANIPKSSFKLMSRQTRIVIYFLAMVVLIIGVDFVFLRGLFWQRLFVNVAIVLAFAAFYLMFLRHS
jgi:hypothetical protein